MVRSQAFKEARKKGRKEEERRKKGRGLSRERVFWFQNWHFYDALPRLPSHRSASLPSTLASTLGAVSAVETDVNQAQAWTGSHRQTRSPKLSRPRARARTQRGKRPSRTKAETLMLRRSSNNSTRMKHRAHPPPPLLLPLLLMLQEQGKQSQRMALQTARRRMGRKPPQRRERVEKVAKTPSRLPSPPQKHSRRSSPSNPSNPSSLENPRFVAHALDLEESTSLLCETEVLEPHVTVCLFCLFCFFVSLFLCVCVSVCPSLSHPTHPTRSPLPAPFSSLSLCVFSEDQQEDAKATGGPFHAPASAGSRPSNCQPPHVCCCTSVAELCERPHCLFSPLHCFVYLSPFSPCSPSCVSMCAPLRACCCCCPAGKSNSFNCRSPSGRLVSRLHAQSPPNTKTEQFSSFSPSRCRDCRCHRVREGPRVACVCVRVSMSVVWLCNNVHLPVRVCLRACACVRVLACVLACVRVRVCLRACACVRVRVRRRHLRTTSKRQKVECHSGT